MIEASSSSLGEFLKSKGVQTAAATADAAQAVGGIVKPVSPMDPINNAVSNSTDSLEKFTNLLESVNKLINSPLISGVMNKGVDRKTAPSQPASYSESPAPAPIDNGLQDNKPLPPPRPEPVKEPEINKEEKAELYYNSLLKGVEKMKETDPLRTIEEVYNELNNEEVKKELIKQFMEIV
jgi:hypothetical protein